MSRKKTILVVCPNPLDATSFYRGAGPLTYLAKDEKINLVYTNKFEWPTLRMADLVFFQRPAGTESVNLLKQAKNANIPVWADYDDLLMSVPESNPACGLYSRPEVQASMWAFLQHSDYLTVSTPFLAKQMANVRATAPIVIPNAWDDVMLPKKLDAKRPGVVWRGSGTHDEDLYSVLPAFSKMGGYKWDFIGQPFWLALQQLKEYTVTPWKDIHGYYKSLEEIGASVQIVPLMDNGFNRSKSNIAWIEATRVGSVVVSPPWEEWIRPGIENYIGPEDFTNQVAALYSDMKLVRRKNAESWAYIEATLRLSEINKERIAIIEGAL